MPRYITIWKLNLVTLPPDLKAQAKVWEAAFAALDGELKKGTLKEFGFFDAYSGYAISEGTSAEEFQSSVSWFPGVAMETHEAIPYEKGKQIVRAVYKARLEAMK